MFLPKKKWNQEDDFIIIDDCTSKCSYFEVSLYLFPEYVNPSNAEATFIQSLKT